MKKSSSKKFLTLKKETLALLQGSSRVAGLDTVGYPCATRFNSCDITPVLICDLK